MRSMPYRSMMLALALSLAGCEGWLGSGSPLFPDDPEPDEESVEGLWEGSATQNGNSRNAHLLLTPGAYAYMSILDADGLYSEMNVGQTSLEGDTLRSTTARHYRHDVQGFFVEDGTTRLSGPVSSRNSMTLSVTRTVDGNASTSSLSLAYKDVYERDSALATLSGNYSLQRADVGNLLLSIDSNGVMTGSNGDCTINGQAAVVDTRNNLYSLTLSFGADCAYTGPMSGWAWLDYSSSQRSGLGVYARTEGGDVLFAFRGDND